MKRKAPIDVHRRRTGRIIADGIEHMDNEDVELIEYDARRLRAIARFLRAERHRTLWQRLRGRGTT